jgi:transcriptional regulator of acetoin/glycerol metabolism
MSPSDQALREALAAHKWHRADAARALGISRTTLWRRMREAGLA